MLPRGDRDSWLDNPGRLLQAYDNRSAWAVTLAQSPQPAQIGIVDSTRALDLDRRLDLAKNEIHLLAS